MAMDVRTGGRIAAALVLTGVVALVVWSIRSQPASTPTAPPSGGGTAAPPVTPGERREGATGIAGSGRGSWTRADPRTGALESRLDYDRLSPLPEGRYELERPGAWFFENGEARALVSAPKARVVWPSRNEPPEAGDMLGGVTVRIFPSGAAAPGETPALDAALYTLSIESVHFEGAMSQIESADPLRVRGPGVEVDSSGLVLRVSPKGNRLEYFRTLGGKATIDPAGIREASRRLEGDRKSAPAGGGKPSGGTPGVPDERGYQFALGGDVSIAQDALGVRAATLKVWALLRDGRLPPDAVADFRSRGSGAAAPEQGETKPGGLTPPEAAAGPITLAWASQLELKALPERPEQLAKDLLAARLESNVPSAGGVKVVDTARGISATAGAIEYSATTRRARVVAPDGGAALLAFTGDPNPEAHAAYSGASLSVDLTTGVASVEGAGNVTLGAGRSGLSWSQRADVLLDTSDGPVGAGGVVIPTRVTISGGVRATSPEGTASAGWADARFARAAPRGARPFAWVNQIDLKEQASVAGAGGSLSAGSLSLRLEPAGATDRRSEPAHVSARGDVIGSQEGELLTADALDAALVRDEKSGRRKVGTATAEGRVRYTGGDALVASADRLEAEAPAKRLTLQGAPAEVGRGVMLSLSGPPVSEADREQTRVRGNVIRIDGVARTLTVPVAGEAERTVAADETERFTLRWSRGLTYDDGSGRAEVVGAVSASGKRGEADAYAALCERAVLELASAEGRGAGTRTLAGVSLSGQSLDGVAKPVSVQAKRFTGTGAEARMEGLVDLRGPELTVNPVKRTVTIPGPGRIVVEDRRSLAEARGENELRGTSVIDWTESMTTDEATGVVRVRGGVRVRHLAPGATEATLIESGSLGVGLIWPEANDADQQPRLSTIGGDGGVYVKHQRLQLTGDSIAYEALRGVVVVEGPPDRPVTVQDSQTGTTTTAEAVELDPKAGTWRATKAGTIVVPR